MKTNNKDHYKLIKAVFMLYCEEHNLTPYNNAVTWEHGGFSCLAFDDEGLDRNFRAVDAACNICKGRGVEYCYGCGRSNEIDFEEV